MRRDIIGELHLKNGYECQTHPHFACTPESSHLLYSENASRTRDDCASREDHDKNLQVDGNARKLGICPSSGNTTCHLVAAHTRQALRIQVEGYLTQRIVHGGHNKSGSWTCLTSKAKAMKNRSEMSIILRVPTFLAPSSLLGAAEMMFPRTRDD
jgi:hypothetical protein